MKTGEDEFCGLFITGTDTDVGKTYVTALIARQLLEQNVRVGAYKPVCSGAIQSVDGTLGWSDIDILFDAIGGTVAKEKICPQKFQQPLVPPLAARREGESIDSKLFRSGVHWWQDHAELLLVEGVGGLLCPLTETETIADLALDLGFPLLIVSRLGLGTINHTLMTLEIAKNRGLSVAGIILNAATPMQNDVASRTNPAEIAARVDVPVLGVVEHNSPHGLLQDGRLIRIDWRELAGPLRGNDHH